MNEAAVTTGRVTPAEGRRFGFTLGLAFAALAGLLYWRGFVNAMLVLAVVGGAFLLAGLLVPARLGPVQRGWMTFALLLSKVTTPIFMSIVYYLAVTPTGLFMRLLRRNPLARKSDSKTYWIARSATGGRGSMENQF
jgi:hypothetical protein